jgi:hypothetical protein
VWEKEQLCKWGAVRRGPRLHPSTQSNEIKPSVKKIGVSGDYAVGAFVRDVEHKRERCRDTCDWVSLSRTNPVLSDPSTLTIIDDSNCNTAHAKARAM